MSSARKCKSCGSSDIEVDPARGDAVCTNCGSVLEVNIIVAEVQFEEGSHGTSSAIGQFVSADSKGGATKFGASFHVGTGAESREITLRKARKGITRLCNQLQLNQHHIDTSCNFFKLALNRHLTKGRRNSHVYAACVYLTCRTEGTAHLLIDISDVLQICCYELGRTYLKLSQALSISIPALDPCLYILRFAAKLQFGPKTQQVANTALRLVQRMKRDSIHSGRRPSGLCGAALLIASRLHEFGRSASDIVKIVKVHESTLRKRLIEFGDTPSSALTLEEFMTVDLEEEQDPPAFKAARKKDKERLQRLMEEEADSITELQQEIETQLNKNAKLKRGCSKKMGNSDVHEVHEAKKFIRESSLDTIHQILKDENIDNPAAAETTVRELGPDIASMGLANSLEDTSNAVTASLPIEVDLTFDDIDDEELDSYIMTDQEAKNKNDIWLRRNADFLQQQKLRAEKLQKEREEGKPEKKRRRQPRRKPMGPTNSAGEAIEKILQEKKISTKINYDVLKSLNASSVAKTEPPADAGASGDPETDYLEDRKSMKRARLEDGAETVTAAEAKSTGRQKKTDIGLPVVQNNDQADKIHEEGRDEEEELEGDYEDEDQATEEVKEDGGLLEMLRKHREDEEGEEFSGYEEEDY